MWGGIRHRQHYSEVFRKWNASQPLEKLRLALFKEPRPWFLGFSLHQHHHQLSDHQFARLLCWCTAIVQLEQQPQRRQLVYRYSHELFQLLSHAHKVGDGTLQAFFRLCEVGRDLTAAFGFQQYLLDTGASLPLTHLTWLLRVAIASPSDEAAEDMAEGVREMLCSRFCNRLEAADDKQDSISEKTYHAWRLYEPESAVSEAAAVAIPDEEPIGYGEAVAIPPASPFSSLSDREWLHTEKQNLDELYATFRALRPRITHADFVAWIESLPVAPAYKAASTSSSSTTAGLPRVLQRHAVLPHLEAGLPVLAVTSLDKPRLRDSIFHPTFIAELEDRAFDHDVPGVLKCVERYRVAVQKAKSTDAAEVGAEDAKQKPKRRKTFESDRMDPSFWRQAADPSSKAFRHGLVNTSAAEGALPSELYHYVLVALAARSPTVALSTAQRVEAQGMRLLDLTRAVLIKAAAGSKEHQVALMRAQFLEVKARRDVQQQLEADGQESCKAVELYWKYDSVGLLHELNALSLEAWYRLLLPELGVQTLLELILEADASPPKAALSEPPDFPRTVSEEKSALFDLVAADSELRKALAHHFWQCRGAVALQQVLDDITHVCPLLDVALMDALPLFKDYILPPGREIATSPGEWREQVLARAGSLPFQHIFLLDASFVESHPDFLGIAKAKGHGEPSLIVVPFVCLQQLAESVTLADAHSISSSQKIGFDPTVRADVDREAEVARERLQTLSAVLRSLDAHGRSCLISSPKGENYATESAVRIALLHFTESLLAHVPLSSSTSPLECQPPIASVNSSPGAPAALDPANSDNDHLILVAIMLRALCPKDGLSVSLYVCSDDKRLLDRMEDPAIAPWCRGIQALSSEHDPTQEAAQQRALQATHQGPHGLHQLLQATPLFTPVWEVPATPQRMQTRLRVVESPERDDATIPKEASLPTSHKEKDAPGVGRAQEPSSGWLHMLLEEDNVPKTIRAKRPTDLDVATEIAQDYLLQRENSTSASERIARTHCKKTESTEEMSCFITPTTAVRKEGEEDHSPQATTVAALHTSHSAGDDLCYRSAQDMTSLQEELSQVMERVKGEEMNMFLQFDSVNPEEHHREKAGASPLEGTTGEEPRRRRSRGLYSPLGREMRHHRGYSSRQRYRMARDICNAVGSRVPFNFKYAVYEANVNDPRNKHLWYRFQEGVEKTRHRKSGESSYSRGKKHTIKGHE